MTTQAERLRALRMQQSPVGDVFERIQMIKGEKGDTGDKGDSIVGPQGPQGESIVGPQGPKGDKGDSVTGPRGPKGDKGDSIIGPKGEQGDPGIPGISPDIQKIVDSVIKDILSGKKLKASHISDLKRDIDSLRELLMLGGYRGGGDTVAAGNGVTITTVNGIKQINASGGSGANIATEVVTAVQSGTDVTIALSQLAHTYSSVLLTAKNGQILIPNGNAGLPGSSWSQSGNVVTVYNADATESFQIQYSYV